MINFVIGPACSGKSTFIKNTFHDALVIDLWDYQKGYKYFTVENILESYEDAKDILIEAIKERGHHQIVLEHTMLKKERRAEYIKAIREITDEPINCFVLKPSMEAYKEFCRRRDVTPSTLEVQLLQDPKPEEGFASIYTIIPTLSK